MARPRRRAITDAPKCVSCHGSIHEVKAASEPDSTVARKNLADTCAKCHSDAGFLSRHQIPVAHPVESYKQSVHGRAIAAGSEKAADCNSCHGNHDIYPAKDERSRVNHWKVSQTCGECHGEIAKIYSQSVHGAAVEAGVKDAPACVDCHGEHLILDPKNPASPVNAANVSAETCGRCHASTRMAQLYDHPCRSRPVLCRQLSRPGVEGWEAHGRQLRFLPRRSQYFQVRRSALHGERREPGENLRAMPHGCPISSLRHRSRFTCKPAPGQIIRWSVDSLDVPDADPGDAGFHAATQFAGSAQQIDCAGSRVMKAMKWRCA